MAFGGIQIGQVVLGNVLKLNQAASPAPCPGRAVKLRDTMDPTILADGPRHGFILFHGGLGELKP